MQFPTTLETVGVPAMPSDSIYTTFNHSFAICQALNLPMIYSRDFSDASISLIDTNLEKISNVNKNTFWIHNGHYETYIPNGEPIPDGWVRGRVGKHGGHRGEYTSERGEKISASIKHTITIHGNKNKGRCRSAETIVKMKVAAKSDSKISASKQNLAWNNFICSCVICKQETSNAWFSRKHQSCFSSSK